MSVAPASAPGVPATKPRRRQRRVLWLAGLLALGVLTPVAAWLYVTWNDEAKVASALAATDALDPRWRWADLLADRPPIADEQNSALVVARVIRLRGNARLNLTEPEHQELQVARPTARLTPAQAAVLRTLLGNAHESLVEARKLHDLPLGRPRITYSPDIINTLYQPVQDARHVGALLFADAVLRAEDGDATGALQSCQALLNAGRSVGDEPFAIALLVRMACIHMTVDALERTLAQGQPDADALAAMQAALERELAEPVLLVAMRGERAGHYELLQRLCDRKVRRSQVAASIGLRQPELDRLFGDYVPTRAGSDRAAYLKRMNALVEAAKLPIDKQPAEFDRLLDEIGPVDMIEMLPLSLFQSSVFEYHRAQANLRCAIVGLAAERYRRRHDAWPASLSVLVDAGLLKAVPMDPYTGQAVKHIQRAGAWAIYSIGPDRCDDRGNVVRHAQRTVGQRRRGVEGTDQGVRLYDVDRRGR